MKSNSFKQQRYVVKYRGNTLLGVTQVKCYNYMMWSGIFWNKHTHVLTYIITFEIREHTELELNNLDLVHKGNGCVKKY